MSEYQLKWLDDQRKATKWLGHPGADEGELAAAEQRLGVVLPPSLRNFLAASNGFEKHIYGRVGSLYPVNRIEHFVESDEGYIADDWAEIQADEDIDDPDHPVALMRRALLLGGGDEDLLLLDPTSAEGAIHVFTVKYGEFETFDSFEAFLDQADEDLERPAVDLPGTPG